MTSSSTWSAMSAGGVASRTRLASGIAGGWPRKTGPSLARPFGGLLGLFDKGGDVGARRQARAGYKYWPPWCLDPRSDRGRGGGLRLCEHAWSCPRCTLTVTPWWILYIRQSTRFCGGLNLEVDSLSYPLCYDRRPWYPTVTCSVSVVPASFRILRNAWSCTCYGLVQIVLKTVEMPQLQFLDDSAPVVVQ